MRIFAISDLHLDYPINQHWLQQLSLDDYRNDTLLLAGDISDSIELITCCFDKLTRCFANVVFVPGNHDLWVRPSQSGNSIDKFRLIQQLAQQYNVHTSRLTLPNVTIYPLLGWYDYSFGIPNTALQMAWMDYRLCRWPQDWDIATISRFFLDLNQPVLNEAQDLIPKNNKHTVISVSHFLPRIDVMPKRLPAQYHMLYPVMGSSILDRQLRQLRSNIHIYGHHHLNRNIKLKGIRYINNALGNPGEAHYLNRQLVCVYSNERYRLCI